MMETGTFPNHSKHGADFQTISNESNSYETDPDFRNFSRIETKYGTERLVVFSLWYAQYHGYVSLVVCAFGITCNVFNMIVLTRKHMVSVTNYILTALALSDMLTMVSYVPFALQFYCLHGTLPTPQRNSRQWMNFFLFHVNFTVVTHTSSIWLGVILAAFRFAHVRLSMLGRIACDVTHARCAVLCIFIGSILVLIPNYLSLRLVTILDISTNKTIYELMTIDSTNPYGHTVTRVNFWFHAVLIKLLPCILLSIFGILLICTMQTTHRKGERLRRHSIRCEAIRMRAREHTRTTAMLIVVIILFLVTELPQGILALCSGLLESFFDEVYVPLGDVMDIVALINNSVNFTLYCSMSKQFRETCLWLICKGKPRPRRRYTIGNIHYQYSDHSLYEAARTLLNRTPLLSWVTWTTGH